MPLVVLAVVAGVLWFSPSDHFLFLPDPARQLDALVRVPNESQAADEGGIYMVDILVRKASLFERLFPQIRDGATLVPSRVVNPIGVSERQRRRSSLNEMSRSQKVAVAVALRELGHEVKATPIGAVVSLVVPESPAGGKLEPGDVIVAAKGRRVRSPQDLREIMTGHRPGDPVSLTVQRSGGTRVLRLGTEPDPENRARALIGVLIEPAADIDLPVNVRIDAGDVGGPSAGLAFALDVVDELGRDLDDGRRIAVTGELDLTGTVFAVGGVKQKAIGAELAGADVFVVPDENAAEARKYADDVEVVAVSSFDEALTALATE